MADLTAVMDVLDPMSNTLWWLVIGSIALNSLSLWQNP